MAENTTLDISAVLGVSRILSQQLADRIPALLLNLLDLPTGAV
jgi:hypothetical protein